MNKLPLDLILEELSSSMSAKLESALSDMTPELINRGLVIYSVSPETGGITRIAVEEFSNKQGSER